MQSNEPLPGSGEKGQKSLEKCAEAASEAPLFWQQASPGSNKRPLLFWDFRAKYSAYTHLQPFHSAMMYRFSDRCRAPGCENARPPETKAIASFRYHFAWRFSATSSSAVENVKIAEKHLLASFRFLSPLSLISISKKEANVNIVFQV